MNKFFDKKEEVKEEEPKEELVKLGDQEYKPEELEAMVGVAGKVKEFEEKSGTDFDGLTTSWGKRGEEIGSLKKQLEEANKEPEPEPTPEEAKAEMTKEQVIKQAKEFGLVAQDDLDTFFEQKLTQREQGQAILKSCTKMEKSRDGKDGRPEFKTEEILEFMKESGVKEPEMAYKLKFESELDTFKEEKLSKKKPSGLVTESDSTAGGKQPKQMKTTIENLDEHVKEVLHGG